MPMHETPPRDLKSLRKWRAELAEKKEQEYLESIHKKELVPMDKPSPAPAIVTPKVPTEVTPRVPPTLKKKAKQPNQFPLIGSRAKGQKGQSQKGEEGYLK